MNKIKIVEKFDSLQGEGVFVGVPSVFVRVFGCNYQCSGFGQPRDNLIPLKEMPFMKYDLIDVKSVEELPVFNIGCDSSAAWSKRYRHLCDDQTIDELYESLDMNADNKYKQKHLVITGGEPLMLRNQPFWVEFFTKYTDIKEVTFETNGSYKLSTELYDVFYDSLTNFTFSVSPKLSLTGEKQKKTLKPEAIGTYNDVGFVYLKYVIRDAFDIDEVKLFTAAYKEEVGSDLDVYLMPEGATIEGLELTERCVADLCMEHGFLFSPRLHIQLYGNSWGT